MRRAVVPPEKKGCRVTAVFADGERVTIHARALSVYGAIHYYDYLSTCSIPGDPEPRKADPESTVFEVQSEGGEVHRRTLALAMRFASRKPPLG